MQKVLVLVGDACEELDAMYPIYRLREAGYQADVAALTRREVQLVIHDFDPNSDAYTEKNGRKLPVDIAFSEVDPVRVRRARDPGRARARVHPARRRRAPDHRVLLREGPAGRHDLPRAAGAGRLRAAARAQDRRVPAAAGRHGERGRDRRGRAGLRRREHGLLPRLAGHARVVARVHERARAGRRPRLTSMARADRAAPARLRPGNDRSGVGVAGRSARAAPPGDRARPAGVRRRARPRRSRSGRSCWRPSEPCAVVGNSAGGALALRLAHARAVTRVVAVGLDGRADADPAGAGRAVGVGRRRARCSS